MHFRTFPLVLLFAVIVIGSTGEAFSSVNLDESTVPKQETNNATEIHEVDGTHEENSSEVHHIEKRGVELEHNIKGKGGAKGKGGKCG